LKRILIALAVVSALATAGCSSSGSTDEGTVKPGNGVATNPGGKPQTPEQAAYAAQMQKTGAAMNAQRDKDAAAMAAARAKAGGQ
jgi:ABC-type oligopeptide transport system substrate-binding subunit